MIIIDYPEQKRVKKGNAFIAAIFIMAILATLGTTYFMFSMNTKNLIRSSYVDQIADFLCEAGAREAELMVRREMSNASSAISKGVFEAQKNKPFKVSYDTLPETDNLIKKSNIESTGGGLFSIRADVFFDGVDQDKGYGCYGAEKTGNVRVVIYAQFKKTSGKANYTRKWRHRLGFDFRVVNIMTSKGYGGDDPSSKFDPNPVSDYVLWVRAAGLQNALSYGQVMHPRSGSGRAKLTIDAKGSAKVFMGSGFGFEDINGNIKNSTSTNLKKLDIAPLFINVPEERLPAAPATQFIKTSAARNKASAIFADRMAKDAQQAYNETKPKAYKDVKAKMKSKQKKIFGKKYPSDSQIESAARKAAEKAATDVKKGWIKQFKTTTIGIKVFHFPITPTGNDGDTVKSKIFAFCKDEIGKFLATYNRKKTWNDRYDSSWKPFYEGSFDSFYNSILKKDKWLANSNFNAKKDQVASVIQAYHPISFVNVDDDKMEGNFRKRFFQAAVLFWDTSKTKTGKDMAEALENWKKNRPDFPVCFWNPNLPAPNALFTKLESNDMKNMGKAMKDLFKKNSRKGTRKSNNSSLKQPILCTGFNSDYRYHWKDNNGKMDVGVKGQKYYLYDKNGSPKKGNHLYFQPFGSGRFARFCSYWFRNEATFKSSSFFSDGEIYLKGVMWVKGDLHISSDTVFSGRGILLATGNIYIAGNLSVAKPGKDYCILFAKGKQTPKDIIITKSVKITNISLWALNERYRPEQITTASTIRTNGNTLDLTGNYVADRVGWASGKSNGAENTKDSLSSDGNKIVYDTNLSIDNDIFSMTMANRYNEWQFGRVD